MRRTGPPQLPRLGLEPAVLQRVAHDAAQRAGHRAAEVAEALEPAGASSVVLVHLVEHGDDLGHGLAGFRHPPAVEQRKEREGPG